MPDPISSALTTWKNQTSRTDPLVTLYEVSVSDSTTLYYVAGDPDGTGSVSYDGNTYKSAAVKQSDHSQNIEGDLPSVSVSVSNIDGSAGGYIELNDMHGREVTITYVLMTADGLSPDNSMSETYTIQDQAYDRQAATFVLSHANFFNKKFPTKQFLRYKCRWPYEQRFVAGNGCGYPRDEFQGDTKQNFKTSARSGEQERRFGWYTVNASTADLWDVDISSIGSLYISTSEDSADWSAGNRKAHAQYKFISGDFDAYTELNFGNVRDGMFAGILCQDYSNQGTWIKAGRRVDPDEPNIVYEVSYAVNDVEVPVVPQPVDTRFIRLRRVGNKFTAFRSDSESGTWTEIFDATIDSFVSSIRLGLILSVGPLEQGSASVSFPYLRFTDGGLANCDRTFDGVNGCSEHGNTHRFFGFRGIPAK